MPIQRNIRRNSDLKFVMIHHSEHFEPIRGKDINAALVQEGFFGVPFDIIINIDGKIDLSPRWVRAANPTQYVENAPLYSVFTYPLHDISDACPNQQMNYQALHILVLGNFDTNLPSIAQINTLEKLMTLVRNNVPSITDVLFHGDVVGISCPGALFQNAVRKDRLRNILLPNVRDDVIFEPRGNIIPVLVLVDNIQPDVNLSWNNIATQAHVTVAYYNIYRINQTLNGSITLIGTSTGTTFADTNVVSDFTYTYYVTAVLDTGFESQLSNPVTTTVSGVGSTTALEFDTAGTSGDIARTAAYLSAGAGNTYSYTIEMWLKVNALPTTNVGRVLTLASNFGFVSDTSGQGLSFTFPNNSIAASGISTGATFVVGQTHHWAFVFEIIASTSYWLTVYKDGVVFKARTQKVISSSVVGPLAVELGRSSAAISGQVNNTMALVYDEVRVWNTIRTQSEIQALMNQTLSLPQTNLVGCWGFDNHVGNSITDVSVSGQTMTNTGGLFVGGLF